MSRAAVRISLGRGRRETNGLREKPAELPAEDISTLGKKQNGASEPSAAVLHTLNGLMDNGLMSVWSLQRRGPQEFRSQQMEISVVFKAEEV